MKKIPTIFKRDPNNMSLVLNEENPACLWVFEDKGVARQKLDGTCCMFKDGVFYKRYTVRKNKKSPNGFIEADHDKNTGKKFGWIKIDSALKENIYHMEAIDKYCKLIGIPVNGTYELIGEKIQGNPEKITGHSLLSHNDAKIFLNVPRDYEELKEWFKGRDIEGLIFSHNGEYAKIKKKDFGLRRDE